MIKSLICYFRNYTLEKPSGALTGVPTKITGKCVIVGNSENSRRKLKLVQYWKKTLFSNTFIFKY